MKEKIKPLWLCCMHKSIKYPANLIVDFSHLYDTGGIHRMDFNDYYAVVQIQALQILVYILKWIILYILYLIVITTKTNVFTQTVFFSISLPTVCNNKAYLVCKIFFCVWSCSRNIACTCYMYIYIYIYMCGVCVYMYVYIVHVP